MWAGRIDDEGRCTGLANGITLDKTISAPAGPGYNLENLIDARSGEGMLIATGIANAIPGASTIWAHIIGDPANASPACGAG